MRHFSHGRLRRQFRFLKQQFLQDEALPASDLLSEEFVAKTLVDNNVDWVDRLYTPVVTLWLFIGQVLHADQSCRAAVTQFNAHRVSRGLKPASPQTGGYCQARSRLPEQFFSDVARESGRTLDRSDRAEWRWKNRRVYAFDGSTVSMPDSPENQSAYPQVHNQRPGVGFPIARIAAVVSMSCGAVVELEVSRYAGKGQSELGMLHRLWHLFQPGDVFLGDRYFCNYAELAMLKGCGVDSVTRLIVHRKADFRRGHRLGKDDQVVVWKKPTRRPWLSLNKWRALPDFLTIREVRFRAEKPGFRSRQIVVATTLLDPDEYSPSDLAELYRIRWNVELDYRSLKETLQMDVLRCQTPAMVRKEIWMHVLAHNLVRALMVQAAVEYDIPPRAISYKGTIQTIEAFQPGHCDPGLPPPPTANGTLRPRAGSDCLPPRGRPTGPYRATTNQTPTRSLRPHDAPPSRSQTSTHQTTSVELSAIRPVDLKSRQRYQSATRTGS